MFKGKTILITGGTGSWGNELTKQLLEKEPKEIRIYSRGELSQVTMQREFRSDKLTFIVGDVRDYDAIESALKGVDYVFHLAALKHVPVCEAQPAEAIKTNIIGTENVIKAAIKNKVKKVLDISTDKAVDAVNLYGMTKAVGERLVLQANAQNSKTRFVCIRGGNVLGTNGSVVPFFKKQICDCSEIPLTDFRMTRFFLTVQEAISLLFKAAETGIGGETFVMQMPACKIMDLAAVLVRASGKTNIKIHETGIRPGEKLHEVLVSNYEAQNAYQYDENYYVILGSHPSAELKQKYSDCPRVTFDSYQSCDQLMTDDEIEKMLVRGGFLP